MTAGASASNVRTTVRTHVTRTQIRLGGSAPNVVVDGRTYHDLTELPQATRYLVVDELRVALPNVPEAARAKLEAFIASAGTGVSAGRGSESDPEAATTGRISEPRAGGTA